MMKTSKRKLLLEIKPGFNEILLEIRNQSVHFKINSAEKLFPATFTYKKVQTLVMGIPGFQTQYLNNKEETVKYVDLVQEASTRDGLEILVDFYAFQSYVYLIFLDSMEAYYGSPVIHFPGGEYKLIDNWYAKLVKSLKNVGISLVFYIDGCKGSNSEGFDQKFETWRRRQQRDDGLLRTYLYSSSMGISVTKHKIARDYIRPVFLGIQVRETLLNAGCEIIECTVGEADHIIAQEFHLRPKAYAIFTNDSDFAIFKDSVFITEDLFDLNDDLGMNCGRLEPKPLTSFSVGLVSTQRIMSWLSFTRHDQLIELSILGCNDFTGHILRKMGSGFWSRLRISSSDPSRRFPQLVDIAAYIRSCPNGSIYNDPHFQDQLHENPEFYKASEYSTKFYNLELNDEKPNSQDPIFQTLDHSVRSRYLTCHLIGMHLGCYWQRTIVEDIDRVPAIDALLKSLRARLYLLLLSRGDDSSVHYVREYGRGQDGKLREFHVYPTAYQKLHCPTVDRIEKDKVAASHRLLHSMMTYMEGPDFQYDYIHRYGRRLGVLCLCLRFMLRLNWNQNLYLLPQEFLTLVSGVFALTGSTPYPHRDQLLTHRLEFYYRLKLVPGERCITIWNWMQMIFFYATEMIGKLLYLEDELPKCKDIFASSVFFAFYMAPPSDHTVPGVEERNLITQDKNAVLSERRHMVRTLTEGIFPFSD